MKKKIINRVFSILLALVIMVSCAVLPAGAAEIPVYDFENPKMKEFDMGGLPDVSQAVSSNPAQMPVFHLWLTKDNSSAVLAAFYVHDPVTNGTYLVSAIAGNLIENSGYTVTALRGLGYEQTPEYLGSDGFYGYFSAPGLNSYAPFEYSQEASSSAYIPLLLPDDNYNPQEMAVIEADLSTWNQGEKSYIFVHPSQEMGTFFYSGSPVISASDLSVFGVVAPQDDKMAVYVLPAWEFNASYSLTGGSSGGGSGSGSGSGGSSDGGSGGSSGGSSKDFKIPVAAIVIVVAVAAYFIYTKFIKKPTPAVSVTDPGTVSFDDPFKGGTVPADEGFMSPGVDGGFGTVPAGGTIGGTVGSTVPLDGSGTGHSQGVTRPAAVWQLRGVDGQFSGKVFPLSTSLKIGRSSQCDIKFPGDAPGISGLHCEVTVSGDNVALKDLGSSYGTFLSGSKLFPQNDTPLSMGDVFCLTQGGPSFRLEKAGAAMDSTSAGGPTVRDANGKVYHADGSGRITFGRNPSCVVSFGEKNSSISGNHCVIYREGGKLYIKDTNSTNGTFFSERERLKPNTPYRIRKGMAFFLTTPKYTFVVTED